MTCDGACIKNQRFDITRVCCGVRLLHTWRREPLQQLSLLRSIRAHVSAEHAESIRSQWEQEGDKHYRACKAALGEFRRLSGKTRRAKASDRDDHRRVEHADEKAGG